MFLHRIPEIEPICYNNRIMRILPLTIGALLCAMTLPAGAQLSEYDLNAPFGWATSSSLTQGDDYDLTGGGTDGQSITLTNNGGDMRYEVEKAIENYDIIIFDGSKGDFTISQSIVLEGVKNKTFVGINGARLCTEFYITDEIKQALDEAGVKDASTSGSGGTLSNGEKVDEECEFLTRQTLIDLTNDESEMFRKAGLFHLSGCENLIFRNLKLVGPGPVDVGGNDLFSVIDGTTHCWFDHCEYTDGIDGNMDITVKSDFITVSWCTFSYTERAYNHMNTNLIGGDDTASKQGADNLNVTWANCMWGSGCDQRMPMARFGTIHIYNCYYNCSGNKVAINPRKDSEFLIENNYFASGVNIFSQTDAKAYVWHDNYFEESYNPSDKGSVSIPYQYSLYDAYEVADVVSNPDNGAGATLSDPLTIGELAPSSDATLRQLFVNGISVTLQEGIYHYSYALPSDAADINITATTSHSKATYQVTTPAIDELPATATIVVTAQDGTTQLTYTISLSQEIYIPSTSTSWIFDNWSEEGKYDYNFSHDGLTVHATASKPVYFENAEEYRKTFADGNTYTKRLSLGGSGSTEYRSVSFTANAGDKITIYNTSASESDVRYLAISNGSDVVYSESNDMLVYTFTESGTYYVYSTNSGIRIYALVIEHAVPYTLIPANNSTDVSVASTDELSIDFGREITSVDMSKISIAPYLPLQEVGNNVGSTTLIFQPVTRNWLLDYSTVYTITVEAGAVTLASETGGADETNTAFAWTFTTEPIGSGIENAESDRTLTFDGTTLHSTSDDIVYVFNLQGMKVAESRYTIDMTRYASGIYIVRCGDKVLRIAKR